MNAKSELLDLVDPASHEDVAALSTAVGALRDQIVSLEARDGRAKWHRRALASALVIASSLTTYGAGELADTPRATAEQSAEAVQASVTAVKEAHHRRIDKLEDRMTAIENRQERIVEKQIDQEELTVQSTGYIVKVLKAGPKRASSIKPPKALTEAEKRMKRRQRKETIAEQLREWDGPREY